MRGLLMVEPLYHQTVAGNKTQTRRSGGLDEVNGRKARKNKAAIETDPDEWELVRVDSAGSAKFWKKNDALHEVWAFPRYRIGEVLFLKEPTILMADGSYKYRFDGNTVPIANWDNIKWGNKLFMSSDAAREYVKITGIKCERLWDISDEDSIAEGIEKIDGVDLWKYYKKIHNKCNGTPSPRRSFFTLFMFANKIKDSDAMPNPWVWVYTFEYLKNYKA